MGKDLESELESKKNELAKLADSCKNIAYEIDQLSTQKKQLDTDQQRLSFTLEMQKNQNRGYKTRCSIYGKRNTIHTGRIGQERE